MQPLAKLLLFGAAQRRHAAAAGTAAWAAARSSSALPSALGGSGGSSTSVWASFTRSMSGFTMASPTKLDEVMHVDQLQERTPDEIEQIWLQFHEDPSQRRVADVMSADEYKQLQARARSSPMFVLPLSKPGGFMTLLINWQGPLALITSVEEYRRFGGGAPPHMTITHYTELSDSKGLVLVRGDVINDAVVNMAEARTLLQLARAFYTDPHAHRLVYRFNHEPEKFSFDALLAELGHKGSGGGASSGASGGTGSSSSGGGGAPAA